MAKETTRVSGEKKTKVWAHVRMGPERLVKEMVQLACESGDLQRMTK